MKPSARKRKAPKYPQNLAELRTDLYEVANILWSTAASPETAADAMEAEFEVSGLDTLIKNLPLDVDADEFVRDARKCCTAVADRMRKGQLLSDFMRSPHTVQIMQSVPEDDIEAHNAKFAELLVEQAKLDPGLADEVEAMIEILVDTALEGLPDGVDADEHARRAREHWVEIVARMRRE